ncbi:MAG: hypothetical protein KBD01_14475 [Acidobacteria bacterium]|nr:hypothetical protein [Acidobacteriota bacterium]
MKACLCLFAVVLSALAPVAVCAPAAEHLAAETKAEVPELFEFHEVIFRIWHEAWPAKDTALLASLLPEVEKGAAQVAAAELPGILREKKTDWAAGVEKLNASVAAYRAAVERKDDPALLGAAEDLHRHFEGLVRVIRPVTKEIGAFHEALYPLYHYHLPAMDVAAIRADAKALAERVAAVDQAAAPQRLAPEKKGAFEEARARLSASVAALQPVVAGDDQEKIRAAVEQVHSDYVKLEAVFD